MTTVSGRNARDNQTHSTYEKILYTGNRSYQCEYCCARNDGALCAALPNCRDRDSGERFIFKPVGAEGRK